MVEPKMSDEILNGIELEFMVRFESSLKDKGLSYSLVDVLKWRALRSFRALSRDTEYMRVQELYREAFDDALNGLIGDERFIEYPSKNNS